MVYAWLDISVNRNELAQQSNNQGTTYFVEIHRPLRQASQDFKELPYLVSPLSTSPIERRRNDEMKYWTANRGRSLMHPPRTSTELLGLRHTRTA